jgi:hypothetical protein
MIREAKLLAAAGNCGGNIFLIRAFCMVAAACVSVVIFHSKIILPHFFKNSILFT